MQCLDAISKNDRMISVRFQGKPFNIMAIQVYASTSNAEEAEVEWFYEDLQDLLELTPKKDVHIMIGDWNAKVGSRETPGVTGKFDLGVQNETGQRLTKFCQENFTFTFHFPALEKEMATHSSVLAWRIPGTGEPGGLRSMGSCRVGHD